MTYLSQSDINAFFCLVAQRVAASPRISVAHPEFKSISEIRSEIAASNPDILSLLDAFFVAYQGWHNVHAEIEAAGASENLNSAQNAKLQAAIGARDNTRRALLAAIAA